MPYADAARQAEYQRQWKAARRDAFLEGKTCVQCSGGGPLEIDHIDPVLKVDHKIWTWSAARRAAELAKCQVLCVPCHDAKTREQRRAKVKHGYGRYQLGCRCDVCRQGLAQYFRDYRKARKERLQGTSASG